MSIVAKPNNFTNGTTADATAVNANFDALFNDYNGNINDANIAASGITTYGKVDGSAIKNLANVAVAAGQLPAANVATLNQNTTGTANNVTGTVAIGNGGTGQTTAQAAIDALLPAQGSANGKFLTSNGSTSSWGSITTFGNGYTAGTTILLALNVEHTGINNGSTYGKVKETPIPVGGTFRIAFDLACTNDGGVTVYGRVYRNGVAVGTEQSVIGQAYVTKTEDISGWNPGDLVQLYVKDPSGYYTSVKNFKIMYAVTD